MRPTSLATMTWRPSPTLLLADAAGVRFLGALLPQAAVLERMFAALAGRPAAVAAGCFGHGLDGADSPSVCRGLSRVFA